MKKSLAFTIILLFSFSSFALNRTQVRYEGGTASSISPGAVGRFDTTSDASLIYQSAGRKIEIPYASIESHQYTCEIAHRLGFLPTIAVGLLKVRQRRHFLRIAYRDAAHKDSIQVVVFEVPKQMPRTLQPILDARAPRPGASCVPCSYFE